MRKRTNVEHSDLNLHAQKVRDVTVYARTDVKDVFNVRAINFTCCPHILEEIIFRGAGFFYAICQKYPLIVIINGELRIVSALTRVFDFIFEIKHFQCLHKFILGIKLFVQ